MPLDIMTKAEDTVVDRDFLFNLALPDSTKYYETVSHERIITNIEAIMEQYKPEYRLVKESFVTNRKFERMFFKMYFQAEGKTDLIWGGRNGYDHKTAYAHATGAGVFVCSNLCIRGTDANYIFDHRPGVWDQIMTAQLSAVASIDDRLKTLQARQDAMKQIEVQDRRAFEFMGFLRGNDKLSANQMSTALSHWTNPPFEEFKERNAWSLYNSVTWAFGKSKDPQNIIKMHTDFDDVMEKEFDLV